MRHREFFDLLGEHSALSAADLDGRGRELRKAGLIGTGPRGLHAPHVTAAEAARILIALAGSKKAIDAAAAVKLFWGLGHIGGANRHDTKTFGDTLTAVIADEESANRLHEVRIGLPGKSKGLLDKPFAKIVWRDGDEAVFRSDSSSRGDKLFIHIGGMRMGAETYVGGELIAYIAGKIGEHPDA